MEKKKKRTKRSNRRKCGEVKNIRVEIFHQFDAKHISALLIFAGYQLDFETSVRKCGKYTVNVHITGTPDLTGTS